MFEENCYNFVFYLLINFKFLKDAILGIIFYIHIHKCYQLVLIKELVSKMRYLCFDLMFLSKINQVILVAIFLFLDLRSKLQNGLLCDILLCVIPIWSILVLDRCYFQKSNIITKSVGIIWQKVDASIIFGKFLKKIITFSYFICLKT